MTLELTPGPGVQLASVKPEPTSPDTVPPTVYPLVGGGGGGLEAPPPPPHPTMSKARTVTDPIKRSMTLPLWRLPMGISCRSKHLGVHEHCVKVGCCFVKIQEGRPASWPRTPRTIVGLTRIKLTAPSASQPAG